MRAVSEAYFAFGANVHPATLARRGVVPIDARPARLDGHRLVFDQPGLRWLEPAFASVRPDPRDHVWGVLYRLSSQALARLRAFEGSGYDEISVQVEADGAALAARAFVTRGAHPESVPSRRYLRLIREGAAHHGLPPEWLARLDAHPRFYLPMLHEAWAASFVVVDRAHRWLTQPSARR
jgi:gamma-glutamylcyclotransferase (GGCT)/AIG2-like uncharacterized protein YtfP